MPALTLPLCLLSSTLEALPEEVSAVMKANGDAVYWTRSISTGNELDADSPAYPLPQLQANALFVAVLEHIVLWLGLTSDWPNGSSDSWPTTLGLEDGALLAVWDYDYYVVLVATRPQRNGSAFVEFRITSHASILAQQSPD